MSSDPKLAGRPKRVKNPKKKAARSRAEDPFLVGRASGDPAPGSHKPRSLIQAALYTNTTINSTVRAPNTFSNTHDGHTHQEGLSATVDRYGRTRYATEEQYGSVDPNEYSDENYNDRDSRSDAFTWQSGIHPDTYGEHDREQHPNQEQYPDHEQYPNHEQYPDHEPQNDGYETPYGEHDGKQYSDHEARGSNVTGGDSLADDQSRDWHFSGSPAQNPEGQVPYTVPDGAPDNVSEYGHHIPSSEVGPYDPCDEIPGLTTEYFTATLNLGPDEQSYDEHHRSSFMVGPGHSSTFYRSTSVCEPYQDDSDHQRHQAKDRRRLGQDQDRQRDVVKGAGKSERSSGKGAGKSERSSGRRKGQGKESAKSKATSGF